MVELLVQTDCRDFLADTYIDKCVMNNVGYVNDIYNNAAITAPIIGPTTGIQA